MTRILLGSVKNFVLLANTPWLWQVIVNPIWKEN